MIGIAIGNGLSRQGFDLSTLKGPDRCVVGCNWICRDYDPDIIVAIDTDPVREFAAMERRWEWLSRNHSGHWIVMVHPDGSYDEIMETAQINGGYGKNSGIIACSYLSKHLKCDKVYMLGFDFFRLLPGQTKNDLYHKGLIGFTKYEKAWNLLTSQCSQTEFIRVGDIPPTEHKFYYEMLHGLTYITTDAFKEVLAT